MKFTSFLRLFGESWPATKTKRNRRKQASNFIFPAHKVRPKVERLEDRILFAVIPQALVSTGIDISGGGTGANQNSPSVAVDPVNPLKLVSVYSSNDPNLPQPLYLGQATALRADFSIDGGVTWTAAFIPRYAHAIPNALDPTFTGLPQRRLNVEQQPSVAMDRQENVYILSTEQTSDGQLGELVLRKYNFSGTTLVKVNGVGGHQELGALYRWGFQGMNADGLANEAALNPTIAVDTNLPTFTDPVSGITQTDPGSGNIYVAYETNHDHPSPAAVVINPNGIRMMVSSDGGLTFSSQPFVNANTWFTRDLAGTRHFFASPRIAISQGTAPGVTPAVPPGAVTVVFDDFFQHTTPQVDPIYSNRIEGAVSKGQGYAYDADPPQMINDAMSGSSGMDIPATTDFPIQNVDFSNFDPLQPITDFTVTVNIQDNNAPDLLVQLQTPLGTYTLIQNHISPDGKAHNGVGITGQNIGVITVRPAGSVAPKWTAWDTVFDNSAPRFINDMRDAAPYTGHFFPEGGALPSGFFPSQARGTWTLHIVDNRNDGSMAVSLLHNWALNFSQGMKPDFTVSTLRPTGDIAVNYIQLPGTDLYGTADGRAGGIFQGHYPNPPQSLPEVGVGPGPVVAADSTLGTLIDIRTGLPVRANANEGRLYAAWTAGNGNTSQIHMAYSDDGGMTWNFSFRVNDDSLADGFSEDGLRPKIMPEIAVDSYTGTVVVTYYDGRYDPDRLRFTRTIAASIDGGVTWNKQGWGNPSQIAPDAITGNSVVLQPIPDNQSSGNPNRDKTYGFGDHQGLAVADGHIYSVWSGNRNGGRGGGALLHILGSQTLISVPTDADLTATALIGGAVVAAGPRIIDSTMGPVQAITVANQVFNDGTTPEGLPLLQGFAVVFDRPIDVTTFTDPRLVEVRYRNTDPQGTYVNIPVSEIRPLDLDNGTNPDLPPQTGMRATTFFIFFETPQTATGTYSYTVYPSRPDLGIGPIRDNFRNPDMVTTGNAMDQNANGLTNEIPNTNSGGDAYSVPTPLPTVPKGPPILATVGGDDYYVTQPVRNGPVFEAPFSQDTLPLVIAGPHVVATSVPGNPATPDNLVLNQAVTSVDVVFDRDMQVGTFDASKIVRVTGPTGTINGPFTVMPVAGSDHPLRTFRITFPTAQQLPGTYTIVLSPTIQALNGDQLDTSKNAGVDILFQKPTAGTTSLVYNNSTPLQIQPHTTASSTITIPNDIPNDYVIQGLAFGDANHPGLDINVQDTRTLSAYLIAPDGTQVQLFTDPGTVSAHTNFRSTILDDAASKPNGDPNPIQAGAPAPFTGSYNPQQALSVLNGRPARGVYRIVITNDDSRPVTLTQWTLVVQKAVSLTGLGEPIADQVMVPFRIFLSDTNNPLSHQVWNAIGPASITSDLGNSESGRIGGIAVDPSDPSGNTVYVAGASGGVWKTTDFLTTDPVGPTYQPLTDLGPTFGINIGGLAVFGRNNDPNQTIVVVGTGEGDTLNPAPVAGLPLQKGATDYGRGFLISYDGGATWNLMDSTNNTLPFAQRDHRFNGTTTFKIAVDPRANPVTGGAIIYAAMGGSNGGLWKSTDSGMHWRMIRTGYATDVVLAPSSVDATTGNMRIVYAGFRGEGVFMSDGGGDNGFMMMDGTSGDKLIRDVVPPAHLETPVANTPPPNGGPNGNKGRIVLASPALSGSRAEDLSYQGWLYAYVATTGGTTDGFYVTKDFGQNWTKVHIGITNIPPSKLLLVPTNSDTAAEADILGSKAGAFGAQGNYDISIAIDPTNPNIVYLGGTADAFPPGYTLLRVDLTGLADPHNLVAFNNFRDDTGKLQSQTTGPISLTKADKAYGYPGADVLGFPDLPYLNLFRDPLSPFASDSTLYVGNPTIVQQVSRFNNDGIRSAIAPWVPVDPTGALGFTVGTSTDQHRVVTMIDPLTGHARLIFGDDQGIFTLVDKGDLTFSTGVGTAQIANGSRNGNLQITQFYGGAAQPSQNAANQAGAFFYGTAQDDGYPFSAPDVLSTGNIQWTGPEGDAADVHTDQTGSGTVFHYVFPCCNELSFTDFFQVNFVGRTQNLLQQGDNPSTDTGQWGLVEGYPFAVNPVSPLGSQIVISSRAGRVFRTSNQALTWFAIGEPQSVGGPLDNTDKQALAYGAPDPADPSGQTDDFIYAGSRAGNIYVTFDGGGTWKAFLAGTSGLDGSPVQQIVTNPHRGSHEAYAVTSRGIYHIADSLTGTTWTNITGNIFQLRHTFFGDQASSEPLLSYLTSIVADWRFNYVNNPGPGFHPVLYVGGEGGVFRSIDNGSTWTVFPDVAHDGAPANGGYLPVGQVTHLDLSIGNINPTTGFPDRTTSEDVLVATFYGRGEFDIRLKEPNPVEQVFVQGLNDNVYQEQIDSTGAPDPGGYTLTTSGAIRDNSLTVSRDGFGRPLMFVIGLNDQVYEQKFDDQGNSTTPYFLAAPGQVQEIHVGHDAQGNPELFVRGQNGQIYSLFFDLNGNPDPNGYMLTAAGPAFSMFRVGHDAFNDPEVFALGQNDHQIYYQQFDSQGNSLGFWNLLESTGLPNLQARSFEVGQDSFGRPEVFALGFDTAQYGQVYAHRFMDDGTSDGQGFFRAFFLASDPQAPIYVKSITIGHDANNDPEIFAIGLNDNVYAEVLMPDGTPDPVGLFSLAIGNVKQIAIAYDANNDPELFAIQPDNQVYYVTMDAGGHGTAPYRLLTGGAVKYLATTP
jgi:hypothetical protein